MAQSHFVSIPGSERHPVRGARRVGPAQPDEPLEVTVRLRRKQPLPATALTDRQAPAQRTYLNHTQLEAAHGADPADITEVEDFARQNSLTVVESSAGRRSVKLSGTVAQFSKAFNVVLEQWEHAGSRYRGRTGTVQIPSQLAGIVAGVFGLDNRSFAKPHFRRLKPAVGQQFTGYPPPKVAQFYNFPTGVDGTGQVIGIIELGGGYRPADLTTYFKQIGVAAPNVTAVSVDHGGNHPTNAESADGEVMLDIEVAASIAPGAKIVVYFAAGTTDRDFLDAISEAVHDKANSPSVISISWGGPEASASASFQTEFDQTLQSAAALGITVTVASGDNGAADEGPNEWDNRTHADFPASSPHVLACGATHIQVSGNQISAESVWNQHAADTQQDSFGSSGGGVSDFFPIPPYQAQITLPEDISTGKRGRGVPDVSADGDPASGYLVRVDGQEFPIGGTSAVAPLWAGLIALINQKLGHRAGFINPLLYASPSALRDVTVGDNKVGSGDIGYDAAAGWDACTGLGSPDGMKLLAVLSASQQGAGSSAARLKGAAPSP
jgi:kumamolisin